MAGGHKVLILRAKPHGVGSTLNYRTSKFVSEVLVERAICQGRHVMWPKAGSLAHPLRIRLLEALTGAQSMSSHLTPLLICRSERLVW